MDVLHQISRLRYAKSIGDGEMDLIMRSLYYGVRTYEQIVEVSLRLNTDLMPTNDSEATITSSPSCRRPPPSVVRPLSYLALDPRDNS